MQAVFEILKNLFVTAADIDDSIKRKRFRALLKKDRPITSNSRRGVGDFFNVRHFSISRRLTVGWRLFLLRFNFVVPTEGIYSFAAPMPMKRAESAQTQQIRMLRSVPKATVHNECSMPKWPVVA